MLFWMYSHSKSNVNCYDLDENILIFLSCKAWSVKILIFRRDIVSVSVVLQCNNSSLNVYCSCQPEHSWAGEPAIQDEVTSQGNERYTETVIVYECLEVNNTTACLMRWLNIYALLNNKCQGYTLMWHPHVDVSLLCLNITVACVLISWTWVSVASIRSMSTK